jgi:hypothetical protein
MLCNQPIILLCFVGNIRCRASAAFVFVSTSIHVQGVAAATRLGVQFEFFRGLFMHVLVTRAVESVHKSSDSDSSIFKTPTPL